MHDEGDVERGGGEQVGDWNRIQRDGDALGQAVVADHAVGQRAPRCAHALRDAIGQVAGEQSRIERGQRLAFAFGDRAQARAKCSDVGLLRIARFGLVAVGGNLHHAPVGRMRRTGNDVFGVDHAGRMLAQAGQQPLAFFVGVAVGLVQRQQQRPLGLGQGGQCSNFGTGHVAIDDEDDQVADRGDIVGETLAFFAGQLVDAWRVDQVQALPGDFPCQRCASRASRGAVQDAGREGFASEQCVAERGLADADAAENGDEQLAGLQLVEQSLDLGEVRAEFDAHGSRGYPDRRAARAAPRWFASYARPPYSLRWQRWCAQSVHAGSASIH